MKHVTACFRFVTRSTVCVALSVPRGGSLRQIPREAFPHYQCGMSQLKLVMLVTCKATLSSSFRVVPGWAYHSACCACVHTAVPCAARVLVPSRSG